PDAQPNKACPRPSEAPQPCYPPEKLAEMNAQPPPAGYPTVDGTAEYPHAPPVYTQSKGDDFWKGW
ncbi:hypothetical protein CCACVL1_02106, partial [Corchorus capsularis]